MSRKLPQFRLFDLMMLVLLAALMCAFVREMSLVPMRNGGEHWPIICVMLSFGIWAGVWSAVRTRRTGPVCQECGRRFRPDGTYSTSTVCARCCQKSLPPAQAEATGAHLARAHLRPDGRIRPGLSPALEHDVRAVRRIRLGRLSSRRGRREPRTYRRVSRRIHRSPHLSQLAHSIREALPGPCPKGLPPGRRSRALRPSHNLVEPQRLLRFR